MFSSLSPGCLRIWDIMSKHRSHAPTRNPSPRFLPRRTFSTERGSGGEGFAPALLSASTFASLCPSSPTLLPRGGEGSKKVALGLALWLRSWLHADRVVAFDNFGASICSRFLPSFSRSASHERSSAVRSHHLPKNLFASTFFALHFLPSRPRIGIPSLRLRVKRTTLDFAPNAFL
jgi:hypothetical protein